MMWGGGWLMMVTRKFSLCIIDGLGGNQFGFVVKIIPTWDRKAKSCEDHIRRSKITIVGWGPTKDLSFVK